MVIKEKKISGKTKTAWMTFVKEENQFVIAFSDNSSILGRVEFGNDEDLASGLFDYLGDRFDDISFSLVKIWIKKLVKMKDGKNVFFYLSVADKKLTLKEIKTITKRSSMSIEEDEFQIFVTDGESAVGKFNQVSKDKFKFVFDI